MRGTLQEDYYQRRLSCAFNSNTTSDDAASTVLPLALLRCLLACLLACLATVLTSLPGGVFFAGLAGLPWSLLLVASTSERKRNLRGKNTVQHTRSRG